MKTIGYVLGDFPVFSETFVGDEMRAMAKRGHKVVPIVMRLRDGPAQTADRILARDARTLSSASAKAALRTLARPGASAAFGARLPSEAEAAASQVADVERDEDRRHRPRGGLRSPARALRRRRRSPRDRGGALDRRLGLFRLPRTRRLRRVGGPPGEARVSRRRGGSLQRHGVRSARSRAEVQDRHCPLRRGPATRSSRSATSSRRASSCSSDGSSSRRGSTIS